MKTAAHRTAIVRGELSRPTRLALTTQILNTDETFFDYGCGRGEDVVGLKKMDFAADGWDPNHSPDAKRLDADIVNIGYVVNVIVEPQERMEALKNAWGHASKALVVAARLNNELRSLPNARPHGDGFITEHDTFQKFYSQTELRAWIDSTLEVESIAVAPGMFVVFKHEGDANNFLIRNRRRRAITVKISRADRIYDEHRELLDELVDFYTTRGRLPRKTEELELQLRLKEHVGGLRRSWSVVHKVAEGTDWAAIADSRRDDLLVDIALLKLNRRPRQRRAPRRY